MDGASGLALVGAIRLTKSVQRMEDTVNRWRAHSWRAAIVNGALFVLVPVAWLTYSDYTDADVFRPVARTLPASVAYAVRNLLILFPISLFVGWRTYHHTRAYCQRRSSVWRGPLESAAVAGALSLLFLLAATPVARTMQTLGAGAIPIAFVVGATAIVGLLLGVILAATALLALSVSRGASGAAGS